ncbi:GNAT family N-acetyltransferase [Ohtaekwangia kribbensis]|jgi:GNAT superfamily N-acetyltransferase|uniref:GNAT family N-acetyltransferase n=1 Tax=Ohtaekwangia kribbensis TaxID=688913 RepID=A0ABW3K260_9BACT
MNILKEYIADGFTYSSDRTKIDIAYVHRIVSTQLYWAKGIPFDTVKRSVENSLSFGIYTNGQQVGFARLVTDYATFGYLADVFVDEQYRGRGLSKTLMEFIFGIDELKVFRRMVLVTRDAHTLYERYGFTSLKTPDTYMELHRPEVYSQT